MNVASFALELTDGLSGPSAKAKASIANLKTELDAGKKALAGFEQQLRIAEGHTGSIAGRKVALGGIESTKAKIAGLESSLSSLTESSSGSARALGSLGGSAGVAGLALGAVAVAAGVAIAGLEGVVDVTRRLVVFSLETVNANDRLRASFEALGGAGAGGKTLAMLDGLAERLPQSRTQLAEWTQKIQAMGVTDLSKIRQELVATASAQAIMGDQGAAAYERIQQRVQLAVEAHHGLKLAEKSLTALYKAGVNEADVAQRMGMTTTQLSAKLKAGTVDAEKFGAALRGSLTEKGKGPLDAMMNSLSSMATKAGEALAHLFDGIDTKPLTEALRGVIALGDQGAPSGQTLKMGLVPALNAIIKTIGGAVVAGEILFLKLEIGALKAYIALKPYLGALGTLYRAATFFDPASIIGRTLGDKFRELAPPGKAENANKLGGPNAAANTNALGPERRGTTTIEHISVNARHVEQRSISTNAFGPAAASKAGPQNVDKSHHIGSITVSITAPDGVTDAAALSVTGLSSALERAQLASGR